LTDAGHEFLRRVGVAVYPLSAIRSHPMLQALLLKDNKKMAEPEGSAVFVL
jgi:hypothetical protein